jgi:Domain of unknown function (DUF6458)
MIAGDSIAVSAAYPIRLDRRCIPSLERDLTPDPQGGTSTMGIGVSLILIAVGAVLTWAVDATVSGLNINAVGVILMIVGVVGLLLSLMFWSSWGGPAGMRRRTTTTYVDDGPPPGY